MYRPYQERALSYTYRQRLETVLEEGYVLQDTPQGVGARTLFGTLPSLSYPIENGVPVITERALGWKAAVGEMCAFINGVQDFDLMKREFDVPEAYWGPWVTDRKCMKVGADPRHLGDGSYGPAMARFPTAEGSYYDQFENVIRMLKDPKLRTRRTMYITPWIPYMNGWGKNQRAVVSPCHGWMHFRAFEDRLHLVSWHRAADLPLGFANDMVSYAATLLMVSQVTNLTPGVLTFQISDAHIYTNQDDAVREMLGRDPRRLPIMKLDPGVRTLSDFRPAHFTLEEYEPHPKLVIPSAV